MKNALLPVTEVRLPRQLTIALEAVQMNGLSVPERSAVLLPADGSGRSRGGADDGR